jgi:hypothetical protein
LGVGELLMRVGRWRGVKNEKKCLGGAGLRFFKVHTPLKAGDGTPCGAAYAGLCGLVCY